MEVAFKDHWESINLAFGKKIPRIKSKCRKNNAFVSTEYNIFKFQET